MSIRTGGAVFLAIACFQHRNNVGAAPVLNFPVNAQVPPVVRVSRPFSFTFAESTFIATEESISYTLMNEPSWLQFDADNRTFFGNPTSNEAGPSTFNLVASDNTGSTSSAVTLIVTDQSGPYPGKALLPQLSKAGPTSAPSSLLLYPLEAFTITFTPDTFADTTRDTTLYATSADCSPLPAWLQFDAAGLRFSGTSPSLVSHTAKPQEYGVRLIASDIAGFAEAVTTFQIVVGYRLLASSAASHSVDLLEGQWFETEPLRKGLTLDGKSIEDAEMALVTSNAPVWAELDEEHIFLRGTPPKGATSQEVLIEIADIYGDTLNITVDLVVSSSQAKLFKTNLAPVDVAAGQDFRYTINQSMLSSNDVLVTADLKNASSWLTFNSTSRTFIGSVPVELQQGAIYITLKATLPSIVEQEQLTLNILKTSAPPQSANITTSLPSSVDYPTENASSSSKDTTKANTQRLVIVLAVLLPILFLFCLGMLIFHCCWRRQRDQKHLLRESGKDNPRPQDDQEPGQNAISDLQRVPEFEGTATSTKPPRIDLPWASDSVRASTERLSRVMTNRETKLVDSGWGDLVSRDPLATVRHSSQVEQPSQGRPADIRDRNSLMKNSNNNLNYSRKRAPLRPTQGKIQKPSFSSRASKTLSGLSTMSVGLPMRLSAAGHGAGGPGPLDLRELQRPWLNTVGSITSGDGGTTAFDLDAFPEPPAGQEPIQEEQRETVARASVRLVPSSSSHSGSLVDQRQKWVRERARDRVERGSRFSNAWSPRGQSRAKGLEQSIRSPNRVKTRSFEPGSMLGPQITKESWSQSSSIGAPVRPETLTSVKSPDSHLVRYPSNLRRALSTVSSGRFDSAESRSNSSWVDDLVEEEDDDGCRRWVAVDKISQGEPTRASSTLRVGEISERGSWEKSSRTGGLGRLRANIQGLGSAIPSGERKWKLGGDQGRRPVSVDEGEHQRCQGSQRGNLAFV